MKLEQSFEVQAPIEEVWAALTDLERVAPCLPGASITERDEDGTYHGTFQVKLGPATAAYRGTIRIEDVDEPAHRATLRARGTDKRGQGGASATIVNTLSAVDGGTRVEAVTDFSITGRLAAFGRGGMMQDISNRLLKDFATCLQTRLAADPAVATPTGAEVTAQAAPPESIVAAPHPAPAAAPPESIVAAPAADSPPAPTEAAPPTPGTATGASAAAQEAPPPPPSTGPPMGGGPHAAPIDRPSAPPPAGPVNGFSLFFAVLRDRIRRLFGRRSE
jgi:carbon monoxide dehydrogenase subunit G